MKSAPCLAVLCLALAGCGGDKGGPSLLQSVGSVVSGNDHTCARPAPSGSPEQIACHKEARKVCAEGTIPSRIDFTQPKKGPHAGQFVVNGYSCA